MKIQNVSIAKHSFGFNKMKPVTSNDVISGIIDTIKQTTPNERKLLQEALGLDAEKLTHWQPEFESLPDDIFSGQVFPGIHVTSKGNASFIDNIGNVIRCELARIRGESKPIPLDDFKL